MHGATGAGPDPNGIVRPRGEGRRVGLGSSGAGIALLGLAALIACAPQPTRQPEVTGAPAEPAAEATAAAGETSEPQPAAGDAAAEATQPGEAMVLTGTVRYLDVEGGRYVIESEGTNYNPTELPQEFQVDGMRVEAELRQRDDVAGVGMAGPMVEIVDIRTLTAGDPEAAAEPDEDQSAAAAEESEDTAAVADATLWGSAWRLEDLGGRSAMSGVQVTLEFPDEGRAVGNASCNRFFGQVTAEGDSITFRDIGTMKMACPPNTNDQEHRFLEALGAAERYEIEEPYLRIFGGEEEQPLRFVRVES